MGFADKLRSTINKVTDTVQNAVDTAQSGYEPLPDDISKKYYEIAYGLMSSVYHTRYTNNIFGEEIEETEYDIVPFDAVKKYIEYHLNQPCDEGKLLSILDNYFYVNNDRIYNRYVGGTEGNAFIRSNLADKKLPTLKINKLIEKNNELDQIKTYRCTRDEFYNICYNDIFYDIKSEYNYILEVIERTGQSYHLFEGLRRIEKKYLNVIDNIATHDMIHKAIANSLYEGNETVRNFILEYFYGIHKDSEGKYIYIFASKVAVRAWHFEKYGQDKTNYISITEDECRNFVLNSKSYMNEVENHPFDRDAYIAKYTDTIKNSGMSFSCDYSHGKDEYFIDTICNLAWKEASEHFNVVYDSDDSWATKTDAEKENYICGMIHRYIKDSQQTDYED